MQKSLEIEGLDTNEDSALGDYPIDSLFIRTENRTIYEVIRRIDKGGYIMDPDFQRDFLWKEEKQSKLIESVLMRIPLPVFYLAEQTDGKVIVVDGLQRLRTFHRFLKDEFSLKLPKSEHSDRSLSGKKFSDLSAQLQNRIEDCNLTLYLIDPRIPFQALLDIFERVNSGEPLTRQQMRNCLFMGKATKFLKEQVSNNIFANATGKSLNKEQMRDREIVNRFCAFDLLGVESYGGDMDGFMSKALERMNEMDEPDFNQLALRIKTGLENNLDLFGKHAFRKYKEGQESRNAFNVSLWDVMMFCFSRVDKETVCTHRDEIRENFFNLLGDSDFNEAITLSTNNRPRVLTRFKKAENKFRRFVNAS